MQHYINAWKNYAVFNGRASRKEYWLFVLFNIIFATVFSALDIVLSIAAVGLDLTLFGLGQTRGFTPGFSFFYIFYLLAMLVPGWAFITRRLHDIGKSGWMQLIVLIPLIGPFWLLVLLLKPSVEGETKFDLVDERRKAPFLSLVKVVLIVNLIALVFSAGMGGVLKTSSNQLAMNALFSLPASLLAVATCVLIILAFIRSKEEGRTTPAFWAAFVLFWVHFILRFTTGIQISLFEVNSIMIITQVNTVVGMAASTILFLLLIAEIRRNGSKRSGILLLLSLVFYLLGIFFVPLLAGVFLNNAPDIIQVLNIAQIVTFLIAAVLLGVARIHTRD